MNDRKRVAAYALLAACGVYFVGDWAYQRFYETPRRELAAKGEELVKKRDKRQRDLNRAKRVVKKLNGWEQQSLPSNVDVARSLYRAWLFEQVAKAGLVSPNVDSGAPANRRGLYQTLPFTVRGRCRIDQLTRFLHVFYRAPHLHQIHSLGITPLANSPELDVSLSIEALVLPSADRKDRLASTLPSGDAEDFQRYRVISRRNLFASGNGLDPISQTFLSGITSVDGRSQAWFDLRASNRTVKLAVGGELEAGELRGTIVDIDSQDVAIDADGQRWVVSVGENLGQALAVPRLDAASARR